MKGVQCYELFGGIALRIHTFSFFIFSQFQNGYWAVSSGENAPQSISIEHLHGSATPVTIQASCAFLKQPAMPLLRPINIADTIPYDAK